MYCLEIPEEHHTSSFFPDWQHDPNLEPQGCHSKHLPLCHRLLPRGISYYRALSPERRPDNLLIVLSL